MFGVREHIPVFSAGCVTRGTMFTEAADAPGICALTPATYTCASSTTHLALWIDTVLGWCWWALAPIPFPVREALAPACFALSMPCNKDAPGLKLWGHQLCEEFPNINSPPISMETHWQPSEWKQHHFLFDISMPGFRNVYVQSCPLTDTLPMLIYYADNCKVCSAAMAALWLKGHCIFSFKLKTHEHKEATKAEVMLIVWLEIEKTGVLD